MKSKWTTYLLIVIVLAVWGIVVKKMFFSSPHPLIPTRKESTIKTTKDKQQDTLALNYRDPFLSSTHKTQAVPSTVNRIVRPLPAVKSLKEKVNIKFIAKITHNSKINYLIELNGASYSITQGESVEGFVLTRTYPDSIHFNKNSNTYNVTITE